MAENIKTEPTCQPGTEQRQLEPDPKGLFKDYQDPLSQGVIRDCRRGGMPDEEILSWLKAW